MQIMVETRAYPFTRKRDKLVYGLLPVTLQTILTRSLASLLLPSSNLRRKRFAENDPLCRGGFIYAVYNCSP